MQVNMARIDNRLLHGIVVTQWGPKSKANRVMVINDAVAADPLRKNIMLLAKPNGMAASIISLETALKNIQADKYKGQKLFILADEPGPFLELVKIGVQIPLLTIGCTNLIGEGIKLSNRAYITEEEADIYREIHRYGVPIEVQHVPSVNPVDLFSIISE